MRIKYLLIVFLLFFFTNSFAQFKVGALGGLNWGTFKGDQPGRGQYNSMIGTDFGVMFDLNVSDQIILSLQPSFVKKGTDISYEVKGEREPVDSIRISIDYFTIPLLLKISSKNKHFYAIGGIEAGIPLSANYSYISIPGEDFDIKEHLSEINFVMHFGVGYRIPIGKPTLFIEARYLQGLNNAAPVERPEYNFFPRVRTSDFQVLFGVEVPLF